MKGRSKKATGGVNESAEDLGRKNMRYTADSNVNSEAEERKRGGKAVGKVKGDSKSHAGRKPRKSGGRAGSPFAFAAHAGTPAPGRKVTMNMD